VATPPWRIAPERQAFPENNNGMRKEKAIDTSTYIVIFN